MEPVASPAEESVADSLDGAVRIIRSAIDESLRLASATFALLRAELRLARTSAFVLLWLAFALVFFGIGAWLATMAAIAAGIYQLTGNVFLGIGSIALANLIAAVVVLYAMRGCWRDLSLPRTRRAIADLSEPAS